MLSKILERKLSIIGIFLIIIAADGIIRNQVVTATLPSQLAEIWQIMPFIKTEPATKSLNPIIVQLYQWPFLVTGIVGGSFVGIDMIKFRKQKADEYGS